MNLEICRFCFICCLLWSSFTTREMARRSDRLLERGEAIRALAPGHICGICREMIKFAAQLDGCSHTFCAPCLLRWSLRRRGRTCPTCRQAWTTMTYRPSNPPPTDTSELDEVALSISQEIEMVLQQDEETETDEEVVRVRRPMTGAERSAAWRERQARKRGAEFTREESEKRQARRKRE